MIDERGSGEWGEGSEGGERERGGRERDGGGGGGGQTDIQSSLLKFAGQYSYFLSDPG